jgi:hypothetical protein
MTRSQDVEKRANTRERVDVVVVSYNSREHLRSCVAPIAGSELANVIVVDNASADGSVESIHDLPAIVLAEPVNLGFAAGCNRGWRRGHAPYVLFLNPDSEITIDAIEALATALDADDGVGVVGPLILNSDGSLALSQFRFPRLLSTYSEALYLHRVWKRSLWASETVYEPSSYREPHDVEWLSGACLMIRRELLERLGGLDETYFMYSEDTELCRSVRSLDYSVRFDPRANVVHSGGGSAPRAHLLPTLTRSRVRYVTQNYRQSVAVAHRLGFALMGVTHAMTARGGRKRRRAYASTIRTALFVTSGPAGPRDDGASMHDTTTPIGLVPPGRE